MKKKLSKILIATLLLGCMAGVTPAAAASEAPLFKTGDVIVTPDVTEYETYYRTLNGLLQYRVWNATQGYWVNDWTYC